MRISPPPRATSNRRLGSGALVAAAAVVLALTGCGVVVPGGSVSKAPTQVGEGEVGMEVFSDPTGSTILLVPVSFGQSGPYQFVLDTGASRTVLDSNLVQKLGLSPGPQAQGRGLTSEFQGGTVRVENWRVGDIQLSARTLITTDLPKAPPQGPQFRGLLGSDVLSSFGSIEIDYERRILRLGRRE